jgi:hypothetical protein
MPEKKNPFESYPVEDEQLDALHEVRSAFKVVHAAILANVPNGREQSLALTNLEQAAMWASKGITHN